MKSRRKKGKNPAKSKRIKKIGLQTEERYLSILKELPDIVYEIEPNGLFTFVNNAIRILGYNPKDLIGKHFSKIVHPDDVKLFSRHYVLPKYKGKATGDEKAPKLIDERRTGKRKTENLQIRLIPKKRKKKSEHAAQLHIGEVIAFGDVSSAGYYIDGNKKKFLGTLGIIRDVTERIQLYNDLNVSKNKYQKLVDSINSGLIQVDKQDKILFVNEQLCTMLGYKQEELINKTGYKRLFSKEDQKTILHYNKRRLCKLFDQYEIKMKKKSGAYVWTQIRASPIFDANGAMQGSMGIITDISDRKKQEKKLHYQADLLQNVSDAIISTDMDSKIRTWNKAAEKIYGWRAHEVIDKPMHRVTKAEYLEGETVKNICKELSKKGYWTGIVTERRKDGKAIIISRSMAQIIDASGNIIGVVTVNRDITDIRHAEEELRKSEEKYRSIVELAPDGIVTANKKGIITSINTPFCQQTGYSKKQIIGKHISKMPTSRLEDIPKYIKIFKALLRGRVPKSFEFRWLKRNKSVHWSEVRVSQMKVDGKTVGYQAIIRDITERKANEEARRLSDEKLSLAVEAAGLGLWDQNFKTHTVYRNEQWAKMLGYTVKEIEAQPTAWQELIHPDDLQRVKNLTRKHEKGRSSVFDVEHRMCTKDGQWKWIRNWGKIIERNKKGKPLRALGVHLDISQRKKIEEALRASEERYRAIFEQAADSIVLVDAETGELVEFNEKAYENLGYTRQEFKKFKISDFEVIESTEEVKTHIAKIVKQGADTFETKHRTKDGQIRDILVTSRAMSIGEKDYCQSIWCDITERKRMHEAIRKERDRTINILDSMKDGIYIVDKHYNIEYVNPVLKKEFGSYDGKKCYTYFHHRKNACPWCKNKDVFKGKTVRWEWYSFINKKTYDLIDTPLKNIDGSISKLEIFRDITEQKQVVKKIYREKETLTLLNDLNQAVNRGNSMREIIKLFERRTEDFFSCRGAAVYLLHPDKDHLVLQNLNLPPNLARRIEKLIGMDIPKVKIRLSAESVYAKILHVGKPQTTNDPAMIRQMMAECTENKALRKLVPAISRILNHRHVMSVPLIVNGKRIGLVDQSRQEPFSESDLERFVIIAEQFTAILRRKQAEEKIKTSLKEKEALLKEVHHRVKNNLQIISSLLNLQAEQITDKHYREIFKESQNRIKSMGLVHEKLYRSQDLTAINVHDYVDGLLQHLRNSYGIEQNRIAIKSNIEDMSLNIDTAIPCGLIINELVSNSLKHAFVEPNKGSRAKITIKLHLGGKNKTVLIVSDNGVGFPDGLDFKKTKSLGMQLVCTLTEQLSGNIKLTKDKGTTFTITFKKGN